LAEGALLDDASPEAVSFQIARSNGPVSNVLAPHAVVSQVGASKGVVYDIAAVDIDDGVRSAAQCDEKGRSGGDVRIRQVPLK
jgi:hypothetical protein